MIRESKNLFAKNLSFVVFSGGDRADENARMELPGSGVNENGVHQRRQTFQSMIESVRCLIPLHEARRPA